MINAELDICPGYGWVGGPDFSTRIATKKSGNERRNANNALPRHSYTLPIANIRNTKYLEELKDVFMATRGMLHSFLVKDQNDYKLIDEPFGIGDGATTEFYLQKSYYFKSEVLVRPITKPALGLIVKVDGAPADVVVDWLTGKVTFINPPSAGGVLSSTGEFRVPVRFASDSLKVTIGTKFRDGEFAINGSVDIIEVYE